MVKKITSTWDWPNPGWKHLVHPTIYTPNFDSKALDTTPPIGELSQDWPRDANGYGHLDCTPPEMKIEVRFTCSSCHAEFIQKFKGTHEDYEWLQHHYNKVDHVVVCEPCRNSATYWDC